MKTFIGYIRKKKSRENVVEIKTNILTSESDQSVEKHKKGSCKEQKNIPQTPATIRKQQLASRNELLSGDISTLQDCAKIKIKEGKGRDKFDFPHIFQLCFQLQKFFSPLHSFHS